MRKFILAQWGTLISVDPVGIVSKSVEFTEDEAWAIKAEMYNVKTVIGHSKVKNFGLLFTHKKSPKFLCMEETYFKKIIIISNFGSSKVRNGDTMFVYREVKPNGKVKELYYVL